MKQTEGHVQRVVRGRVWCAPECLYWWTVVIWVEGAGRRGGDVNERVCRNRKRCVCLTVFVGASTRNTKRLFQEVIQIRRARLVEPHHVAAILSLVFFYSIFWGTAGTSGRLGIERELASSRCHI